MNDTGFGRMQFDCQGKGEPQPQPQLQHSEFRAYFLALECYRRSQAYESVAAAAAAEQAETMKHGGDSSAG